MESGRVAGVAASGQEEAVVALGLEVEEGVSALEEWAGSVVSGMAASVTVETVVSPEVAHRTRCKLSAQPEPLLSTTGSRSSAWPLDG